MCKDCVVDGCYVTYRKAQIDKLSAAVAEMAITESIPNIWSVCLSTFDVRCWYNVVNFDCVVCWTDCTLKLYSAF